MDRLVSSFEKRIAWTFLLFAILSPLSAQISSEFGQSYSYLKGSDAAGIAENWVMPDFDDSGWATGAAPFRYGDGTGGTVLGDMRYTYSTVYLRSTFTAENIGNISKIGFQANYDDGFILWLNGEKIISRNAPDIASYDGLAFEDHESGTVESIEVDSSAFRLIEGENTLAIQCFNVLLNSSDMYFDLAIQAGLSLPGFPDSIPAGFSHPSGFYDEAFDLTLTSPSPAYQLVYTLDGSNPQTSGTAITAAGPVTIPVDPASASGRPVTPAFIVRASLVAPDFSPSHSLVRNYIFIEALRNQTYPGGEWPSSGVNGQYIDLDMDGDVLNDSRYTTLLDDAILQIPTVSIATDLENLFDPQRGIYVNAREHGADWERECAIEYLLPDGSEGFQVNAGLRIRGGNSRNSSNPKHAFRLFFREEYGAAKLEYALFGSDGASSYDKIDLRTAQNYSWSMDGSDHNTFVRDIFSRDAQLDMEQPGTRGDYVHLFLNGMYWGLFQTEERPEARYAESYFGDDEEDYDVIKVAVDSWPYFNEATDGNMEAWSELWELCDDGFSSNGAFYALEGKDEDGNHVTGSKVLVDIDNLIDYMLVIFYTGNVDAPVSAWHSNDMPNNFYAIYNRKDPGKGFIFLAHDSEHSMFVDPIYVHSGLYENRVTIDDPPMYASDIYDFQPQWLHEELCGNQEYRQRFADRAFKHLASGGELAGDACAERFSERAAEIDMAIIAESARWGDAQISTPRNKVDDWDPEIESVLEDFIPYRTAIVIDQLKDAGLYTDLIPPVIRYSGTSILDDLVSVNGSFSVTLENQNDGGSICYTLDGQDPRISGGSLLTTAMSSETDLNLSLSGSAVITARIKEGSNWSALRRVSFSLVNEDYSQLRITELHYHPADVVEGTDTTGGKSFEFLELKNTGDHAIDISGIRIDSAITFRVPEGTLLPPDQFYVVGAKPENFYEYYGRTPSGNFSGNFSNSGEYVLLSDPDGGEIISFTYHDDHPWPAEADGDGYSMVPTEILPQGDPNEPAYWRASYRVGGSPFADDLLTSLEEPFAAAEISVSFYPNPTTDRIFLEVKGAAAGETVRVRLIDTKGTLLADENIHTGGSFSLAGKGIAPGIYVVRTDFLGYTSYEKVIYTY
ncbi:MAG: CotH kinase family protein [Bacteroidales bacterium]|nr:CotH kinase family protein [Bacteroidales bacterium]